MRDVKSLAAEIEAALLKHASGYSIGAAICFFSPAGIKAAAAEIAANQSRAFEDGARWMRGVAAQRVVRSFRGDAPTDAERYTLNEAVRCVRLLPLRPEGERSDA